MHTYVYCVLKPGEASHGAQTSLWGVIKSGQTPCLCGFQGDTLQLCALISQSVAFFRALLILYTHISHLSLYLHTLLVDFMEISAQSENQKALSDVQLIFILFAVHRLHHLNKGFRGTWLSWTTVYRCTIYLRYRKLLLFNFLIFYSFIYFILSRLWGG